ncbi:transcriptional regulator [Pseudonocardia sp. C8]|uniref:transcriptional regulator n=1 Tax=Pseudonocardia sp. C8 TaxID=2762759 RepID=UPI0016425417|nr:transcriptional regulator [Pseudonocardia sp. C8]MBC3190922.1 transcriptional regulator [Pseudonocardia sp. C8]
MPGVYERPDVLTDADREWLRVRHYLRDNRYKLAVQASRELYPEVPRVADTPLLADRSWLPSTPILLESIELVLDTNAAPETPPTPEPRYSDLIRRLAPPAIFENRPTYRLLSVRLDVEQPSMTFGLGHYFDAVDTGESVAHEFAAIQLGVEDQVVQRSMIGNPVDPSRRPTNVAISALTVRHDAETGDARFLVHWRDPAKVGHAGGLFQVLPVGVFQPATDHPDSVHNDFSLWRCLQREYAEELLGEEEPPAGAGPIDYPAWPVAVSLDYERRQGAVRTYCLGMGVDPLTLATDLLAVTVIDARVFDRLFASLVSGNSEGELTSSGDGQIGHPLTAAEVERLAYDEPMQAAGAALLALAWEHRETLLPA